MSQKSKAFNWQNIKPVAVLVAICLVVAALLGGINAVTEVVIKERNEAAISESLGKVMKDGQFNSEPDTLKAGAPKTVSKVYTEKTGKGAVVVLVTNKGYTGKNIGLTVGIDTNGKITGMQINENEESIVPNELKPGGSYGEHYIGAGVDDIAELSTGVTVSFTEGAIKNALNDAFVYLGFAEDKTAIPSKESEIEALAKALYGEGAENLKTSIPEDTEYVKRIYKEEGKSSYVAYAFCISQYGTPEFEFLVSVGENGSIKAVEKILWKVSDPKPEWGYNPPTDEEVNGLFNSFVGKNSSNVSEVDIETGATNTAGRVRDAALEALEFFKPKIPREISEIQTLAKALYKNPSADLECIELEGYAYAGLLFREKGESSYIVYSFAISQYGTPEFEFLTFVDENRSIKAVEKILWKVSDPKPEWGYNPPTDEEVNGLFNSFVGKNKGTVSEVDIETGATNTAGRVREAALEALEITLNAETTNAARIVGIVALAVSAAAVAAAVILSKKRRAVK